MRQNDGEIFKYIEKYFAKFFLKKSRKAQMDWITTD